MIFARIINALILVVCLFVATPGEARSANPGVRIETPEVYELANVILAITDYGKSDPLEVHKGTPYYERVMAWFGPYSGHPLISRVNYSREEWESYLGFRTDAYAFAFGPDGRLERTSDFRATSLTPFDDHLAHIEDFARVSRFREFYASEQAFYASLRDRYAASYWINESRSFLTREFGEGVSGQGEYRAVLSPLVGRMNAQRAVEGVQLGFVHVADGLLKDDSSGLDAMERLSEFHTLFTEMDHVYVNPVTEEYSALVTRNFDPALWNKGDGYATAAETFNEYMTWAVYDLMAREMAGETAERAISNWHFINKRRGFIASELFAAKLQQLYRDRPQGRRIRDLYPALLEWAGQRQATLSMPLIESSGVMEARRGGVPTRVVLRFSEPMEPLAAINVSRFRWPAGRQQPQWVADIDLTGLEWAPDGRSVAFDYVVPEDERPMLIFNLRDNTPVVSRGGVYLQPGASVEFSFPSA